jgi:hypothetical protein
MSIPDEYRAMIDKLVDRLNRGVGKWEESAWPGEVFQVVDGHSLLLSRTEPNPQVLVKILGPKGRYLHSVAVQQGDPDFTRLERLYNAGRVQVRAASGASNPADSKQAAGQVAAS